MADYANSNFATTKVRHAFIRKVYTILMIQLVITCAAVATTAFVEEVKIWFLEQPYLPLITGVVLIILMIIMACFSDFLRGSPQNVIFLVIFTIVMSLFACSFVVFFTADTVLMALGLTALVFLTLTVFAIQTSIDFTACGAVLLIGSLLLLAMVILGFFFPSKIFTFVILCCGVALISFIIIYDTQLIMSGRKYEIEPEDYIFAALMLYTDVVFLFIYLLRLLGMTDE